MAETFSLIQRHKGRGIKTWYIRTCTDGKDSYKSTKTTIKAEAMKVFADFVNVHELKTRPRSVDEVIIADEVSRWLEIQENRFGKDANTFKLYRSNVNRVFEFLKQKKITTLGEVNKNVAQEFSNQMMRNGKKATSIEITLRVVKIFFKWMIENYDLPIRSPFIGVSRPKVENRLVEFWTAEQCDSIIEHSPDAYWAAFFGLQCYAGLRFFEARKIRIEDVRGDILFVKQDKTKKDSIIPISSKLRSLLDSAINGRTCGSLFDGYIGHHHSTAAKALKIAVNGANLEGEGRVFCHRLRHSFASNLLREGVNIRAVQTLGRWANPKILLKHYAGVIDKDLTDAVNLL